MARGSALLAGCGKPRERLQHLGRAVVADVGGPAAGGLLVLSGPSIEARQRDRAVNGVGRGVFRALAKRPGICPAVEIFGRLDSTGVDIQRPCPVRQDVGGDRAGERLAGQDDGLEAGF